MAEVSKLGVNGRTAQERHRWYDRNRWTRTRGTEACGSGAARAGRVDQSDRRFFHGRSVDKYGIVLMFSSDREVLQSNIISYIKDNRL
jgi:hypothetical protein